MTEINKLVLLAASTQEPARQDGPRSLPADRRDRAEVRRDQAAAGDGAYTPEIWELAQKK